MSIKPSVAFNVASRTIIFSGQDFAYLKGIQYEYKVKHAESPSISQLVAMLINCHREATKKYNAIEADRKEALK
jgi:hypothetical protein